VAHDVMELPFASVSVTVGSAAYPPSPPMPAHTCCR
jgi:hypothetical protein